MSIRINAHHASEFERPAVPTPIQIQAPRICIDLDGNTVLCAGLKNFFYINAVPRAPKQLAACHVAKNRGVRLDFYLKHAKPFGRDDLEFDLLDRRRVADLRHSRQRILRPSPQQHARRPEKVECYNPWSFAIFKDCSANCARSPFAARSIIIFASLEDRGSLVPSIRSFAATSS
jgi:hypothetical protein